MSPRPLPELPSLTSSFSTAASSDAYTLLESPRPSPSLPPSTEAHTPALDALQSDTGLLIPTSSSLQLATPDSFGTTNSSYGGSPFVVLQLSEPHSPDSAHFSPVHDLISFASPSSSQFQLSLPQTPSNGVSTESVVTYLPLPQSPPDDRNTEFEQVHNGHGSNRLPSEAADAGRDVVPNGYQTREPRLTKRNFLGKIKRFGGRIKILLKGGSQSARAQERVTSALVAPRTPAHLVNVFLPHSPSSSPASRDELRRTSEGHVPPQVTSHGPPPLPGSSIDPGRTQARRFSLPSLFPSRPTHNPSPLVLDARTSSPFIIANRDDSNERNDTRSESQQAVDRMVVDWAASGEEGSRSDAEEIVRGLGLDLTMRSAKADDERERSS
ncbi:hypothetical protein BV25DRAFT_849048 [Artomyces pyxidatus]|uniref:Uncharacterized protein n=1 Tax=Artomyces pyxidatus TaxID=48021 RepID=A0ACB8TGX2_9AGAM|nr:hypothetical protein BV25DRAFT_849048 [Artomyces pyxidatus]